MSPWWLLLIVPSCVGMGMFVLALILTAGQNRGDKK